MEDVALDTRAAPRSWRVTSVSVIGASHLRGDVECQDHSLSACWDEGSWALVTVADGHGSEAHFRSRRGAGFAVEAMREVFSSFWNHEHHGSTGGTRMRWDEAPRFLVSNWRAKVLDDLVTDPPRISGADGPEPRLGPFFDQVVARHGHAGLRRLYGQFEAFEAYAESVRVPASGGQAPERFGPGAEDWDAKRLGTWHLRAYGSTILGVLIGPDTMYWLQLGDGAMMKVIGGEPSYLCPPPAEALANATPSLCDDDVLHRINAGTQRVVPGNVPSAVILATDGVPNSYDEHDGFLKFCADVAAGAADAEGLSANLRRWLPEISRRGSGDDMSVAMAWASERPVEHAPPAEADVQPVQADVTQVDAAVTHVDASEASLERRDSLIKRIYNKAVGNHVTGADDPAQGSVQATSDKGETC